MPVNYFLTIQILLGCAAVAVGAFRARTLEAERRLPVLRDEPLSIEPRYDYDVVISDEQLKRVLHKLRPRFEADQTKINHVDHGLRFWTVSAQFESEALLSGEQMRRLLADHRRFAEVFGEDEPPLLIDNAGGVGVRVQEGTATSSHEDHTLACLAEVGTPLDFPITSPRRSTTFRAMLADSLRSFSMNQIEYEWSAMTYALYLPPTTSWRTTEGQEVSFDRLADRIMREALPDGVCYANHRLYTLAVFLRVDEQTSILSPEVRVRVLDYLTATTATLVQHQHADGFWNGDWPESSPSNSEPSDNPGDRISDRILATGHALEWWAIAPQEVHPPRHVLAGGGQWLVRTIDDLSEEQTLQYYTYLSHAGRALSLWRSRWASDVELPSEAAEEESQVDNAEAIQTLADQDAAVTAADRVSD
jgi:hypothetical protein